MAVFLGLLFKILIGLVLLSYHRSTYWSWFWNLKGNLMDSLICKIVELFMRLRLQKIYWLHLVLDEIDVLIFVLHWIIISFSGTSRGSWWRSLTNKVLFFHTWWAWSWSGSKWWMIWRQSLMHTSWFWSSIRFYGLTISSWRPQRYIFPCLFLALHFFRNSFIISFNRLTFILNL